MQFQIWVNIAKCCKIFTNFLFMYPLYWLSLFSVLYLSPFSFLNPTQTYRSLLSLFGGGPILWLVCGSSTVAMVMALVVDGGPIFWFFRGSSKAVVVVVIR